METGPYKTASIAASPLLQPRRVNQKSAKNYLLRLFYCGRRSSRPKLLPKWRRNRRRRSRFYGAIEALIYLSLLSSILSLPSIHILRIESFFLPNELKIESVSLSSALARQWSFAGVPSFGVSFPIRSNIFRVGGEIRWRCLGSQTQRNKKKYFLVSRRWLRQFNKPSNYQRLSRLSKLLLLIHYTFKMN